MGYNGFHVRFLKFTGEIFDCDCNTQLSTAIQLFIISASTTQSLFSALNRDSVFQRSAAIPTFNRDSVFQRSAAIPTFNRDSVFQRSAAIPTFNRDSVFQRSTAIATFNCDCNSTAIQLFNAQVRLQLSTTIRLFNAQLRFQLPSAGYFFNARFRLLPQYTING